jgi:hypothetical protein
MKNERTVLLAFLLILLGLQIARARAEPAKTFGACTYREF